MNTLKANNGIYLKLVSLFTPEQKKKLESLDLSVNEKAVFAVKVFTEATGDKIENVIALVFGKNAYSDHREEIEALLNK